MKESRLSFRSLSPRVTGLIVGFMWLNYFANDLYDLIMGLIKVLIAADEEMLMGHYEDELMTSYSSADIVSIIISSVIGLIVAVGLLKNHPKIVLAGAVLSAGEGGFYLVQNFMQEGTYPSVIILNAISVLSVVLIILSLVSFREFLSKICFLIVAVANAFAAVGAFVACVAPIYLAEDFFEAANIILSSIEASGFISRLLTIALFIYALVLINYEGEDVQENYYDDTPENYFYVKMKKHLILLLLFAPVWYFVWAYRAVKAINVFKEEHDKYNPGRETLKLLLPFYSCFWNYTQAKRLEEELNKHGADEEGMGVTALLLSLFVGFGGEIYLQDKINQYCIISNKKIKKKISCYDENEGIIPEYPVDTTEQKPTEIVIDD